ncbi:MAG: response regulator, partial [Oscillospiraceae bacterium]
NMLSMVDENHKEALLNAFRACAATQKGIECEYVRRRTNGMPIWLYTKLSYAAMIGDKHIIIGKLTDITLHKELDSELQKYRETWLSGSHNTHTVLIVDDAQINRTVLKKILQKEYMFLEAENGVEAIKILKDKQNQVDLILLDISMPVMDGKEFLKYKKNSPKLDAIPVIIITADDSVEQQTSSFTLGANDFIVKPFVPAAVIRRVRNVLEANHRFKEMVEEYNTMSAQVKTDLMTGLVNRISAQSMISQRLESTVGTCVMVIIDIDNFKKANDLHGHKYGDKIICAVADKLRAHFEKKDIIVRMGGDEFAVFISDIPY